MSDEIAEIIDLAESTEQNDLAVAMELIDENVDESDEEIDMSHLTLPFHDSEREMAFAIGVNFGAALWEEYNDVEEGES
jgi:flagellar biosynthesis protein FliP